MLFYPCDHKLIFTLEQHLQDAPWSFALSSFFRTVSIYGCTEWSLVELSLMFSDISLDIANAVAYLVKDGVDCFLFGSFSDRVCVLLLLSWEGIMFWRRLSPSGAGLERLCCAGSCRFCVGIESGCTGSDWLCVCIESNPLFSAFDDRPVSL